MKKRSVVTVILLSLVTLGIYDLFWLVSTKKVLNSETSKHTPTIWSLFAPLVIVLLGLGLIIASDFSSQSGSSSSHSGLTLAGSGVYLIGLLLFIPFGVIWFIKYSKAVNEYTHGEINTAVAFMLLFLLRFIGIAVIQDKFNEIADSGNGSTSAVPSTTPISTLPANPITTFPGTPNTTQPIVNPEPVNIAPSASPTKPMAPSVIAPSPLDTPATPPAAETDPQQPPTPPERPVVG